MVVSESRVVHLAYVSALEALGAANRRDFVYQLKLKGNLKRSQVRTKPVFISFVP